MKKAQLENNYLKIDHNSCAKRNWDTVLPKYSWEVLGNASFVEITITLEQEWEGEVEVQSVGDQFLKRTNF